MELRDLITEWQRRAERERADTWCNTDMAPIWRSIHQERADVFERCAAQLLEALGPEDVYEAAMQYVIEQAAIRGKAGA